MLEGYIQICIKKYFFLFLFQSNAFALIEVDITRGNLNPLPVAVSPLSIDEVSKKEFEKILKKENIGSEISSIVEKNLKTLLIIHLTKMRFFKSLILPI